MNGCDLLIPKSLIANFLSMVNIFEITSHNCAAATRLNAVTVRIICPPSFDRQMITRARNIIDEVPFNMILKIATDIMASSFWYDKQRLETSDLYAKIRDLSANRIKIGNVTWTQNTSNERQLLVTIELFQVLQLR